jgi:hypothetical protein
MTRGAVAFSLFCLLACCAIAPRASAQYEVEQDSSVWLRALLDVRVARGGAAPSWTDFGPGKPRYGGESGANGFERKTRFVLAQLAIEAGVALPWDLRAEAQINIQPDIADSYTPWVVDAFVRREWGEHGEGWGLQVGLTGVPFSLEHTGPAWSPEYSISASALNSWLWEEISVAGLEGEWWHEWDDGPRLGIVVGAGYGPDLLGRLLALRGWAMGDGLSGVNSHLPVPNGTRTDIFHEEDHRPAAYTWITLGDAKERATLRAGYFDNMGDQDTAGVWHTRLGTAGAILHPLPRIDLVVQYLRGEAHVRTPSNDSSLRAFYGLLSYHHKRHRFTIRYDEFRVKDLDGGNPTGESGDGITAAYMYEWGLRHRVAVEYIWLDSTRPASATPEPSQDGWQLSYRFRY